MTKDLVKNLKIQVENHSVLKSQWLLERNENLTREDLTLWLSQEFFVSVEFVNWFLWTASLTNDVEAKIILTQNIWEELGEGDPSKSHVRILTKFLENIGLPEKDIILLSHTKKYLETMNELTTTNFYNAIGALGPANEYLLKLEYGQMHHSYQKLKKEISLPDSNFFEVNLEADQSHSETLFRLIETICDTDEKAQGVIDGNLRALEARKLFYDGLKEIDKR